MSADLVRMRLSKMGKRQKQLRLQIEKAILAEDCPDSIDDDLAACMALCSGIYRLQRRMSRNIKEAGL